MDNRILGVDIGGTKTAIIYAIEKNDHIEILDKEKFSTTTAVDTLNSILSGLSGMMAKHKLNAVNTKSIGVNCGGPLNSELGVILSPPNLLGWDNVHIVDLIRNRFHIPCGLQNDANASALAEWKYGAGRGTNNMIFLTFGTGLGAGLILNGELYTGTNDNAGEVGHIRLAEFGPVGYGKVGSMEGFASGNGIAQLAGLKLLEKYQAGKKVHWCSYENIGSISAKLVAENAQNGDGLAREIIEISAHYLGLGLAILIDILNPDCIVLGSIYARNENLFYPIVEEVLCKEALDLSKKVCKIKSAELGESIGDYAALSIALNLIRKGYGGYN